VYDDPAIELIAFAGLQVVGSGGLHAIQRGRRGKICHPKEGYAGVVFQRSDVLPVWVIGPRGAKRSGEWGLFTRCLSSGWNIEITHITHLSHFAPSLVPTD
jgi:hypothetical protein